MAFERTQKGMEREERYYKKFEIWAEALKAQGSRMELAANNQLEDITLDGNYDTSQIRVYQNGFSIPAAVEIATISNNRVRIPPRYGTSRGAYFQQRIAHGNQTGWKGMEKVSTEQFSFEAVGGAEALQNQFAPDFIQVLYMVYDAWTNTYPTKGKLQINSGFRYKAIDVTYDAHMCGMGVDIGFTRGSEDRYNLADIAWGLGLRGVAVGPGFVHIDCGPDLPGGWSYEDMPAYQGPGGKRIIY